MKQVFMVALICLRFIAYSQVDTIKWTELSSIPDNRQLNGAGYLLIDSDFYVAGGWEGSSANTSSAVWRYHIPTDTWTQMRNLPFGAAATTSCFVLNNKGYFLTARDSMRNGDCDHQFWQYDASNDTWNRKSDFPDSPRQDNTFFVCNGKGYVGETIGCVQDDSHFWVYDPGVDQWSEIASLPTSIQSASVSLSVSSNEAFLFGGSDDRANFYNTVWRYDISQNSWQNVGTMPGLGREYPVAWKLDSVILIGGGVMVDSQSSIYLANDYYKYDYSMNSWTPLVFENYFDSTAFGSAFIYNKKGYYFGGALSYLHLNVSNKMWSFDASKYIHDTSVGIREVSDQPAFSVYPNPAFHSAAFSISSSESGDVIFYDALGRMIDERRLTQGTNAIRLATSDEVVFYRATLRSGTAENGRIVFIR